VIESIIFLPRIEVVDDVSLLAMMVEEERCYMRDLNEAMGQDLNPALIPWKNEEEIEFAEIIVIDTESCT